MSADAFVIRSKRNQNRKPAPSDPINEPQRSEQVQAQANGRVDLDHVGSRAKLKLVKPSHYLGYFSTR
jgi:hypothetical protein